MTMIEPSESQIQSSFCDYIAKVRPDLRDCLIKIDNEGKTSWALGKRKKAEGKLKGAADLFVSYPSTIYYGLWLEFKTPKGKVSPKQRAFGIAQNRRGYAYKVVRSIDEAINVFERYLLNEWFQD